MRRNLWLAMVCLGATPAWSFGADPWTTGLPATRFVEPVRVHLNDHPPVAPPATATSLGDLSAPPQPTLATQVSHAAGGGEVGCGAAGQRCGVCDSCCDSCGSGLWLQADYLFWTISGYRTPPLVTGNTWPVAQADAGVLPGADILFGNDVLDGDWRSGARLRFGNWFDSCQSRGWEGSFLFLGQEGTNFFTGLQPGNPQIIGRPFFNVDPNVNANDALIIAFDDPNGDDFVDGSSQVTTSQNFYSAHFAYRANACDDGCSRIDLLGGYRFLRLDEGLQVNDQIISTAQQGLIQGTTFDVYDMFDTKNEFHGAELGFVSMRRRGAWSLEVLCKVALGVNRQRVAIDGLTTVTVPNFNPVAAQGGLLALPTNIGQYNRDRFAVLPEIGVNLSYQLSDRVSLTGGWTMIYVSDVVRPGDQIDPFVNGTQILGGGPLNGPARPAFDFRTDDVFVYGANFGVQIDY